MTFDFVLVGNVLDTIVMNTTSITKKGLVYQFRLVINDKKETVVVLGIKGSVPLIIGNIDFLSVWWNKVRRHLFDESLHKTIFIPGQLELFSRILSTEKRARV